MAKGVRGYKRTGIEGWIARTIPVFLVLLWAMLAAAPGVGAEISSWTDAKKARIRAAQP